MTYVGLSHTMFQCNSYRPASYAHVLRHTLFSYGLKLRKRARELNCRLLFHSDHRVANVRISEHHNPQQPLQHQLHVSSRYNCKSSLKLKSKPKSFSSKVKVLLVKVKVKVTLRPTISRSVSPGFEPHVGLVTGY
jgi:hypothetical protein